MRDLVERPTVKLWQVPLFGEGDGPTRTIVLVNDVCVSSFVSHRSARTLATELATALGTQITNVY